MSNEDKIENNNEKTERSSGILPSPIVDLMKKSYIDYAMYVITDRALPDVRDGLKPVHRRIIHAMNKSGLTAGAKFQKSARVVGDVIGKYHPHGDTAVYMTMVGMAQEFTFRYPLIWGQGNFGSVDGDAPAAMRYTESKMQKITAGMLADIEKETVPFVPNYDGVETEPSVLPARIPNLLLNGTLGIAVGMATNIPPHNLGELINATTLLIDNENATINDLLKYVKGPDFPLGGIIFNKEDIKNAYQTGRGGIVVRGEAEIIEGDSGTSQIIITSIPFRVNKSVLVEKIATLFKNKKLVGLKDLRDESTADIRIVIELKRGTFAQKVLNTLYKNTQLEDKFNFNLVALVNRIPKTLNLKDILLEFISFRKEVVRKATEFDLKKAAARAHILEGLKKALEHIDEIIALIKKSKDKEEAHQNLMQKFKFSEIQTTAILEMRLQKLAGLERKKIEDELKELLLLIEKLTTILQSPAKILKIVKEQLTEIKEKYGDSRRTKVVPTPAGKFIIEDLIPDEESTLVLTEGGYIKRTNPEEFKVQNRGGKGVIDMNTKDDDVISEFITSSAHADILFFSTKGKVYKTKMYELPEGKRSTKGKFISNFLPLEEDEKITSVLTLGKEQRENADSLLMVTKNGTVKKTEAQAFFEVRANGLIAINLKNKDELVDARFISEKDSVILGSRDGKAIHFQSADLRQVGRTASGVRGMRLKKDDTIVSVAIIPSEKLKEAELLVLAENGFGKKTKVADFKIQNRGGGGIKAMKSTPKTGKMVGAKIITSEHKELIAMSANSQVIRLPLEQVPTSNRDTQGVTLMKFKNKTDKIVSFVRF